MNFWILQTGEPLHCDGGSPRPMRAMNLADSLRSAGHSVTLWSSSFFHQEKRHRSTGFKSIVIASDLRIELIPSPGYRRNVGFSRLLDHAILARNLYSRLEEIPSSDYPDAIFVGYPPIEAAAIMLRWAKKNRIPSIVDVKDQWPSLFIEAFPELIRPVVRVAFGPYYLLGRRALNDATAFCSMSEPFLDWMCRFSGRSRRETDFVAPLTSQRPSVSKEALADARDWWGGIGVDLSHTRRFAFVGSLSRMFDFASLSEVAREFQSNLSDCQFVICGTGDELESIRESMRGLNNVIFPGWVDQPKIEVLVAACSGMLAPYRNTANFTSNFPNKVIDALASGIPLISSLDGEVRRALEENNAGFYTPDTKTLHSAVAKLLGDPEERSRMGKRARELYVNNYSFDQVYAKLTLNLCRLATKK